MNALGILVRMVGDVEMVSIITHAHARLDTQDEIVKLVRRVVHMKPGTTININRFFSRSVNSLTKISLAILYIKIFNL